MRLPLSFRQIRFIVITVALTLTALAGFGLWRSTAKQRDAHAKNRQQFYDRIRDGVGREVQLQSSDNSPENVRAAVNSVAQFIYKRSGVKLSEANKKTLAAMEFDTLNGTSRRITAEELNSVLTVTAVERLASLTDQDISSMNDSLRGFDAPDLPESQRRGRERFIKLRVGSLHMMTPPKFADRIKELRGQVGSSSGEGFVRVAHEAIKEEVDDRLRVFAAAVPEKFGGSWDFADDRQGSVGLTPLQAILVAYSVASGDYLGHSESRLRSSMKEMQQNLAGAYGQFPDPEKYFAYGTNGYVFSSPLDITFDQQTVNRLLNRIRDKSAK